MKRAERFEIQVCADWVNNKPPVRLGTLVSQLSRGKEVFSFAFSDEWLSSEKLWMLDPKLSHFRGEQFNTAEKPNFGLFLDSSPDRWGRLLQKRRAAIQAREQGGPEPHLLESDFLLGVHDEHRMGALRFRLSENEPFLDHASSYSAPPMTSLRELEAAARSIENNEVPSDPQLEKWLRLLIAPGGSLGGARPKASVVSEKNELWIAKFPSREDQHDTSAWEYVIHQLAHGCGIDVPEADLRVFNGPRHTFLSKRFDRIGLRRRIHFASAMTMLGKRDGADSQDGTSYLELAELIISSGAQPDRDLEQLWRRIVFSMCVSNTDDHLRNHGFILSNKGWILSKAFDMNPNPDGEGLKLNVSDNDNSQDLDLALRVAPYFRIDKSKSESILAEIVKTVRTWRARATQIKIPRASQEEMKRAFRIVS